MRMVWQDMSPFPTPRMDAEEEREMRLAAQARAGAEWALAALIARYQPPVLRYLTRLTGNPQQSLRTAERIFVRMERRLRGPHGGEHLRLWLLRAATEAGLDVLRHPKRAQQQTRLSAPIGPRGLLADGRAGMATDRLRAGLGKIATITGTTRRQVRQLIWSDDEPAATPTTHQPQATAAATPTADTPPAVDPELDSMNPQEALRHRLVRAVLSELPYGDAQCLALHLVGGLNQAEVARALGIRPSAARHRIVQGLQMFAHRYDAAITSLGVPAEVAYAETAESLAAPDEDVAGTLDVTQDYTAPTEEMPRVESPVHARDGAAVGATAFSEAATYDAAFPEVYGNYDLSDVVSAPVVAAPVADKAVAEPPTGRTTAPPVIVDALPAAVDGRRAEYLADGAAIADELPEDYWFDQPTTVPVLSTGSSEATQNLAPGAAGTAGAAGASLVPVLTPPNQP